MRALVVFLVLVPVLDLALMGHLIGFLNTVLLVMGSAIVGYALIRRQGIKALAAAQQKSARGELPVTEMTTGLFVGLAGLLLIHPGFITDILALLCLIPWVRKVLVLWLLPRMRMKSHFTTAANEDVIEGEFHSIDETLGSKIKNIDTK